MRLVDLRKVTVKKHLRIRFSLSNGMECVVNEHGIAQVPALHSVPGFNLEDELVSADNFVVEPASSGAKTKASPTSYNRSQMAAFISAGSATQTSLDEHED